MVGLFPAFAPLAVVVFLSHMKIYEQFPEGGPVEYSVEWEWE